MFEEKLGTMYLCFTIDMRFVLNVMPQQTPQTPGPKTNQSQAGKKRSFRTFSGGSLVVDICGGWYTYVYITLAK